MERSSGILMHITSLPGEFGIGALGEEAYKFVDEIKAAGLKYWQVLPLTPVGYGNSPYSSTSAFANNVLMIDPRKLEEMGLLTKAEVEVAKYDGDYPETKADYDFADKNTRKFLDLAYARLTSEKLESFTKFKEDNAVWLDNYVLYEALRLSFDKKMWQDWPEAARDRNPEYLDAFISEDKNKILIDKLAFAQWIFRVQWDALKSYANENGIEIIGDIPIFPALDSADAWANPELFQLNELGHTVFKAGVPPDYFSEDGQLWGNPLFAWEKHSEQDYAWWVSRVRNTMVLFDIVRIDHFRGFSAYWAVPGEDDTARDGEWIKGPGMDLFEVLHREIDDLKVIAEDLGEIDEESAQLLEDSGYPGMEILMFSLDPDGETLPEDFKQHKLVYTGTHDNNTVLGWLDELEDKEREFAFEYCDIDPNSDWETKGHENPAARGFIEACWKTKCDVVIIPTQDFLGMGTERRMNMPSTLNDVNWTFRATEAELAELDIDWIKNLNKEYNR